MHQVKENSRSSFRKLTLFSSTATATTFVELLPSLVAATMRKKIEKDIPALADGERVCIFSLLCIEVIVKYKHS
jgi:hypothetical protein